MLKIIVGNNYHPEQVFNMDETCLKKMPFCTYPMKDEARAPSFKAQKDRVTLLMCGNAAGFTLKPGLIYKSANPRALKNKDKNVLPVFWMSNKKACVTKFLMSNWFIQCFISQVKEYLKNLSIEFNVLLLMDNAGRLVLRWCLHQISPAPPFSSSRWTRVSSVPLRHATPVTPSSTLLEK